MFDLHINVHVPHVEHNRADAPYEAEVNIGTSPNSKLPAAVRCNAKIRDMVAR